MPNASRSIHEKLARVISRALQTHAEISRVLQSSHLCIWDAETYDPLVLGKLSAKGGIAADISLAQTWYEKAKDLGSAVAPERLARLARLPE
jgi:TPR repeat protein